MIDQAVWSFALVERVDVDLMALDGVDWRDIRIWTGYSRDAFIAKLDALDIEAVAAAVWVWKRKTEPDLTYESVLRRIDMKVIAENVPADATE